MKNYKCYAIMKEALYRNSNNRKSENCTEKRGGERCWSRQSDYDDYYILSKEEVKEQIKNAEKFYTEIEQYLKNIN